MEDVVGELDVEIVTTDGHLGIAAHMRSHYPDITHNQVVVNIFFLTIAYSCGEVQLTV